MRLCANRCTGVVLMVATVLTCIACADSSDEKAGRAHVGLQAATSTPAAWISLSSCVPDEAERVLSSDQFRKALLCSVNDFQWPEGKYPDIPWIMGAEATSPYTWTYQIGFEHTQLGAINQCAWYTTWLEARKGGNEALARQALTAMTEVIPNFGVVIPGYPPDGKSGGTVRRDMEIAAAARLGDPSKVQHFVETSCANIPFVPTRPTLAAQAERSFVSSHARWQPAVPRTVATRAPLTAPVPPVAVSSGPPSPSPSAPSPRSSPATALPPQGLK